jgi:hypothetical protein
MSQSRSPWWVSGPGWRGDGAGCVASRGVSNGGGGRRELGAPQRGRRTPTCRTGTEEATHAPSPDSAPLGPTRPSAARAATPCSGRGSDSLEGGPAPTAAGAGRGATGSGAASGRSRPWHSPRSPGSFGPRRSTARRGSRSLRLHGADATRAEETPRTDSRHTIASLARRAAEREDLLATVLRTERTRSTKRPLTVPPRGFESRSASTDRAVSRLVERNLAAATRWKPLESGVYWRATGAQKALGAQGFELGIGEASPCAFAELGANVAIANVALTLRPGR